MSDSGSSAANTKAAKTRGQSLKKSVQPQVHVIDSLPTENNGSSLLNQPLNQASHSDDITPIDQDPQSQTEKSGSDPIASTSREQIENMQKLLDQYALLSKSNVLKRALELEEQDKLNKRMRNDHPSTSDNVVISLSQGQFQSLIGNRASSNSMSDAGGIGADQEVQVISQPEIPTSLKSNTGFSSGGGLNEGSYAGFSSGYGSLPLPSASTHTSTKGDPPAQGEQTSCSPSLEARLRSIMQAATSGSSGSYPQATLKQINDLLYPMSEAKVGSSLEEEGEGKDVGTPSHIRSQALQVAHRFATHLGELVQSTLEVCSSAQATAQLRTRGSCDDSGGRARLMLPFLFWGVRRF